MDLDQQAKSVEDENLAQTLAREVKKPEPVDVAVATLRAIALPPGWRIEQIDTEKYQAQPNRVTAKAVALYKESFIEYVTAHKLPHSAVWCQMDLPKSELAFLALIDNHSPDGTTPAWRAHRAGFAPVVSEEWKRWTASNGTKCTQEAFALFLEDNLKDVNSAEGFPTGVQMMQMALDFQAKQDRMLKSAVRLQSGGVRLEYVADDDKGTLEAMQMFERFQIAIPVFRDDTARYPLTARLRYRENAGRVTFWYELVRPDLVFESSAKAMVEAIRSGCSLPFYYGSPNVG